eukprot:CAMPEP_0118870590 /NCGR_PEP_ID=MMETSP1163-20130328/13499_1 /TAXON_ID=124430 /ORGANISM="Phaeomonas parva, Strain CCMP2877" /LENGTH=84 /DNA_ID=CAMNT_0006805607 /DNA_START=374 /DNA_END=624 /DNA_ORIENTATION=-
MEAIAGATVLIYIAQNVDVNSLVDTVAPAYSVAAAGLIIFLVLNPSSNVDKVEIDPRTLVSAAQKTPLRKPRAAADASGNGAPA